MIALLGGTFNPPHLGHISAALEAIQSLGIDRLGLMPCKIPPHKLAPETQISHRLAMLKLSAASHPSLYVESLELSLPSPSYTVNTLKHLRAKHANTPLFFLLGEDSLYNLDSWFEWKALIDHCHLIVMKRRGEHHTLSSELNEWVNAHSCKDISRLRSTRAGLIYHTQSQYYTVSSTQLRMELAKPIASNTDILNKWLAPNVLTYIKQHKLYHCQIGSH